MLSDERARLLEDLLECFGDDIDPEVENFTDEDLEWLTRSQLIRVTKCVKVVDETEINRLLAEYNEARRVLGRDQ